MLKEKKSRMHFFFCCGILLCIFISAAILTGCLYEDSGRTSAGKNTAERNRCRTDAGKSITAENSLENRPKDISSFLSFESSLDLQYADQFAVDYYEGGIALITVADSRRYLILPEEKEPPEDLDERIIVLRQPLKQIYLAATAVMDMFCELDALDFLRYSSQKAERWSMQEARDEMEKGNILYAGKYSMPDYERIVSGGCSLAIENNMISHSPEVIEKLEDFGIPVWIDLSSYEDHPLGRAEWIKVYGVLLGKEKEALEVFRDQVEAMERAVREEPSGKTAAFFFITSNGAVNVRAGSDYVPKMIELAGGRYIFEELGEEGSRRSTVTLQMEEFYQAAKEADYLIYNSTIDGEMGTLEELLKKESLLQDFKAVKEGHVWCTTRDMYQQSMSIGQMIEDFHRIFSGGKEDQEMIQYLYPLEMEAQDEEK